MSSIGVQLPAVHNLPTQRSLQSALARYRRGRHQPSGFEDWSATVPLGEAVRAHVEPLPGPRPIKITHLTLGWFRAIRPGMQIGMRQVSSETIEWFGTACNGGELSRTAYAPATRRTSTPKMSPMEAALAKSVSQWLSLAYGAAPAGKHAMATWWPRAAAKCRGVAPSKDRIETLLPWMWILGFGLEPPRSGASMAEACRGVTPFFPHSFVLAPAANNGKRRQIRPGRLRRVN